MRFVLVCFFVLLSASSFAAKHSVFTPDSISNSRTASPAPDSLTPAILKHKKLVGAILAFPLPTGWLGLHRIYFGTADAPWIPFVYVGTIGGCLGILPLIDFCVIVFSKPEDIPAYLNNPHVFFWMK